MNLDHFVKKSLFQPESSFDNSKNVDLWNKIGPNMNALLGYSWNYSVEVEEVPASSLFKKLSESIQSNRLYQESGGITVREEVSLSRYILTKRFLGANLVSLNLFDSEDITIGEIIICKSVAKHIPSWTNHC